MKKTYTWPEYEELIEKLALNIYTHHNKIIPYDQILCLARGGMPIGDAFSRIFKLPLAVLFTSSYKTNKTRGELYIDNQIAKQHNVMGKKILLVDDLVDSGKTLIGVLDNLKTNYNPIILDTAVIWKKECSVYEPIFFAKESKTNEWIIQPFEKFDNLQEKF